MSETNATLNTFIADVKPNQLFWALQDKESEDWVVLDSVNFENSETMPLWSSAELAQQHCCDEWQGYVPAEITLADWLEFWLEDLSEDGVMLGINWAGDDDCLEVELAEFSQALAQVETL
jgi:hypothetical protein